jgi:1-acyl-sn-glycerol-3-phosphate acyltransferase
MCLATLAEGRAVGIYPEGTRGAGELDVFHHGAAYLALVSGAPVVPVTMFGSRVAGGKNSLPPRGSTITLFCGEPFQVAPVAWPRTKAMVTATSAELREHMLGQLAGAVATTGLSLPGPLHPGDNVPL